MCLLGRDRVLQRGARSENLILGSDSPVFAVNLSYLDSLGPLPSAVAGLDRDWTAVFLTQPVILVILVDVLE